MKECFLTSKGPKAVGPYSTAVIHGDTVFVSGMIPLDPATGPGPPGVGKCQDRFGGDESDHAGRPEGQRVFD